MVTKRVPQRALVDTLMDLQVRAEQLRVELRQATSIALAQEEHLRGTGTIKATGRGR